MAKSILIVDDINEVRDELALCLDDEGYTTFKAKNGIEAIAELKEHQEISIVITDLLMPDMDGIELCQHLSKTQPKLKIIAISGGGNLLGSGGSRVDNYLEAARLFGVQATLKKPFSIEQLLDTLISLGEPAKYDRNIDDGAGL